MITKHELAEIIREQRKAFGLSQRSLARILGVSNQTIKNWEDGVSAPGRMMLKKLSEALGIDYTMLFEDFDAR